MHGHFIGQISDGNPLVILYEILCIIQTYENQIKPYAAALSAKPATAVRYLLFIYFYIY